MHARSLVIAAAALTCATIAAAEPVKPQAREVSDNASRPAAVVLASADQVKTPVPANAEQTPAPVKRRIGRVTTCRCGDQATPQQ